jgi:hypothetical protein
MKNGRSGGIRTHDPYTPSIVRNINYIKLNEILSERYAKVNFVLSIYVDTMSTLQ